jgi:RNA polymerase sigma factor (sigma-70 family)
MTCLDTAHVADLIHRANGGERRAWRVLTKRFEPLIRSCARGHRLYGADADDISQETWAIVYDRLGDLREVDRFPGWIRTIAVNVCRSHLRRAGRCVVSERIEMADTAADAGRDLLVGETYAILRRVVGELDDRDQALATLLADDCSYKEISRRLGMPMGSIGPTRQRLLARLRRNEELALLLTA